MTHQPRIRSIDITKGLIFLLMILNHTLALVYNTTVQAKQFLSYSNLGIFSGYVFCFGYVYYVAYYTKPKVPYLRVLRTALRCYFAFLLIGLAYTLLYLCLPLSSTLVWDIVLLRTLPGYSEFMVSFALLTLFALIFTSWVKKSLRNPATLAVGTACCLLCFGLPQNLSTDPLIGSIIPLMIGSYFPIIAYFPIFLMGAYFAKHQLKPGYLTCMVAVAVSLYFMYSSPKYDSYRFPATFPWVVMSLAPVIIYFYVALKIECLGDNWGTRILDIFGKNVLYLLVVSNVVIFIISSATKNIIYDATAIAITYMAVLSICYLMLYLARRSVEQPAHRGIG